jgi:hypothetical protein
MDLPARDLKRIVVDVRCTDCEDLPARCADCQESVEAGVANTLAAGAGAEHIHVKDDDGRVAALIEHLTAGPEHAAWCAGPSAHVSCAYPLTADPFAGIPNADDSANAPVGAPEWVSRCSQRGCVMTTSHTHGSPDWQCPACSDWVHVTEAEHLPECRGDDR